MIHIVGDQGQLGKSLIDTGKCVAAGALSPGDIVINCAAKTNHNFCNIDPDLAWHSNVDVLKNLVETCKKSNAFLIHISTDYVFNKEWPTNFIEDKPTQPIDGNAYAMTKFVAEQYLKICNFDNWICVRSSWLLSPHKKAEWLDLPTVWDQYGSPVWAPNFANALIELCSKLPVIKKKNFYHFTTSTISSRLELASYYKEKPVLTVRCPVDRPYCSALRNTKIEWSPKPLSPFEVIDEYKKAHGKYEGVA